MADLSAVTLYFDLNVFRLEAIKKALYRFTDRVSVEVQTTGPSEIRVVLTAFAPTTDLQQLSDDVRNEVLDQDLRERIYEETTPLRNLIIAHALSKVPLVRSDLENEPFHEAEELQRGGS